MQGIDLEEVEHAISQLRRLLLSTNMPPAAVDFIVIAAVKELNYIKLMELEGEKDEQVS